MVQYVCTEMLPKSQDYRPGVQRAIFQKNAIWRSGAVGHLNITFGNQRCAGCSSDAAWAIIGSDGNNQSPGLNLGFIDPPFEDFIFNKKTYKYDTFKDATRNYCSDTLDSKSCDSGWVPGATVIHEICHTLAMLHEHQNNLFNSNKIKLNKQAVYNYYRKIGMTEEDAQNNVLTRYDCGTGDCDYEGSRYDPKSIMLYSLPDSWIEGGAKNNPTKPNFVLSDLDKAWLRKQYPIDNNNMPRLIYSFTDNYESEWKAAWVQKMVIETLAPIVGIKFTFINMDNSVVTTSPIEYPQISLYLDNTATTRYKKTCVKESCDPVKKTCKQKCRLERLTDESAPVAQQALQTVEETITEGFTNSVGTGNGKHIAMILFIVVVIILIFLIINK